MKTDYGRRSGARQLAMLISTVAFAATCTYAGDLTVDGNVSCEGLTVTNSIIQASSGATNVFNGRVGIGTSAPELPLHVSGGDAGGPPNAYAEAVFEDNSSVYINLLSPNDKKTGILFGDEDDDQEAYVWYDHSPDKMTLHVSGDPDLVITDDDKIGVQTASPSATLHVAGTGRFDDGVEYVAPLGDISMGIYTNTP